MEPVYDLMARLLTEYFGVPEEEITPDATYEQLEIDSLAQAEMVTLLEDHLRMTLDQELRGETLGEAAVHVERLLAGRAGPAEAAAGHDAGAAGPAALTVPTP
ncbi:acyl carrier protein [Streptomyces cinnamoneus]|uniref:acyl carrier protein n=1 Tax=Streptomyces cinnamoneus TaxID=53446 RepID=UPI003790E8CD